MMQFSKALFQFLTCINIYIFNEYYHLYIYFGSDLYGKSAIKKEGIKHLNLIFLQKLMYKWGKIVKKSTKMDYYRPYKLVYKKLEKDWRVVSASPLCSCLGRVNIILINLLCCLSLLLSVKKLVQVNNQIVYVVSQIAL